MNPAIPYRQTLAPLLPGIHDPDYIDVKLFYNYVKDSYAEINHIEINEQSAIAYTWGSSEKSTWVPLEENTTANDHEVLEFLKLSVERKEAHRISREALPRKSPVLAVLSILFFIVFAIYVTFFA